VRDDETVSGHQCEWAGRAIEDYGDTRLRRMRRMLLRRHLEECAECGTRFERMSAVVDALSELQRATPPDDFTAIVMARLIEVLGGVPADLQSVRGSRRNLFIVAGAAAVGLAVGVVLAVLRRGPGRQAEEELAVIGNA